MVVIACVVRINPQGIVELKLLHHVVHSFVVCFMLRPTFYIPHFYISQKFPFPSRSDLSLTIREPVQMETLWRWELRRWHVTHTEELNTGAALQPDLRLLARQADM
jgi:hypothetical protein